MNCRRVEKLIPLYVEGDLDSERADAVESHAGSCEGCTGLIAEYEESQRWLRSFAPPHFEESEFYDLKRGVLKQINEREARAPFLHRLAGGVARRLAFATVAALLVLAGSLAFYAYRQGANQDARPDDLAADDKGRQEKRSPEIPLEKQPRDLNQTAQVTRNLGRPRNAARGKRRVVIARRVRHRKPPDNTGRESHVAKETKGEITFDPAPAQEVLRIEIQTSDPSIRIIWFSPRETNSNPPGPITDTE
jgi:hypothetical protein